MAIVDAQGRVFGRWNLVDALVAVIVLGLIPLSYGAYALFRAPASRLTAIEPATAQSAGDLRVTVRGVNLRPYMRVSFEQFQARTFLFADATRADLDVTDLPPGVYDVVLYDHAQERARLPKAFTVTAPPKAAAQLDLIGSLTAVPETAAKFSEGAELPGIGKIIALGKALPSVTRAAIGPGVLLEVPAAKAVNVPMIVRAGCFLVARGGGVVCMSQDVALMQEAVLKTTTPAGALLFQVDQVRAATPIEPVDVRVRFVSDRSVLEGVRAGDQDAGRLNPLAAGAVVVAMDATRNIGSTLAVSIATTPQNQLEPGLVTADLASREMLLRVPGQRGTGGMTYVGRPLVLGGTFVFKNPGYEMRGTVVRIAVK